MFGPTIHCAYRADDEEGKRGIQTVTVDEKIKKLAELDKLLKFAASATPLDRARSLSAVMLNVEDIRWLAENLRRQLAGGAQPERAYHVTGKIRPDPMGQSLSVSEA
jgi:hypothetical protein